VEILFVEPAWSAEDIRAQKTAGAAYVMYNAVVELWRQSAKETRGRGAAREELERATGG